MLQVIITLIFALIGLVVGYAIITMKMKASKEAAELTLLNAEQDAVNLRGKAEIERKPFVKQLKEKALLIKKSFL